MSGSKPGTLTNLSFVGPKPGCENLVDHVARECFGHPPRDLHHVGLAAVDAIDCKREVQWPLDCPNLVMLIGRKNRGGITNSDPADRDRCPGGLSSGGRHR